MGSLLLYLLFVTIVGTAPAVAVALYFLWDGPPRTLRPWPVARGTRRHYGQQLLAFWLLSPLWLGAFAIVFQVVGAVFGAGASPLLVAALYWSVVTLVVGRFASWLYRAPGPGLSVGAATFLSPLLGVALHLLAQDMRVLQPFGPLAPWLPIIAWNAWVIATIVRAESPSLRALPGACPACGYDLTGLDADTCPECGAERERA